MRKRAGDGAAKPRAPAGRESVHAGAGGQQEVPAHRLDGSHYPSKAQSPANAEKKGKADTCSAGKDRGAGREFADHQSALSLETAQLPEPQPAPGGGFRAPPYSARPQPARTVPRNPPHPEHRALTTPPATGWLSGGGVGGA